MKLNRFCLVAVAGFAIACFVFILQMKRHAGLTPHPVKHKLADLAEASTKTSFAAPDGELFDFVIGVPESVDRASLQGTLTLLQGSNRVYHRTFAAENLKQCNWLDGVGLKGHIISWQNGSNELDTVLQPGKMYEVQILMGERPALSASLWLTHLQAFKAYEKSRATN